MSVTTSCSLVTRDATDSSLKYDDEQASERRSILTFHIRKGSLFSMQ